MALITVTSGADDENANDGVTTLREAIAQANANGEADTIVFSGSVGQVTLGAPLTISAGGGAVTIDGDENGAVSIDGGGVTNHILVEAGAVATIQDIALANGRGEGAQGAAGHGGGGAVGSVLNRGDLTIDNVTFEGNVAQGGQAGSALPPPPTPPGWIDGQHGAPGANDAGDSGMIVNEGALTVGYVSFVDNEVVGGAGAGGQPGGDGTTMDGEGYGYSGNGGAGGDGGDAQLILNRGTSVIDVVFSNGDTLTGGDAGAGGAAGSTLAYYGKGVDGPNGRPGGASVADFVVLSVTNASGEVTSLFNSGNASSFLQMTQDGSSFEILDAGVVGGRRITLSADDLTIAADGPYTGTFVLPNNARDLTLEGSSRFGVDGSRFDNVIVGSDGANRIVGFSGADSLTGGAGNDSLIGGIGRDTMEGGLGNDHFTVNDTGDVVRENAGEGTDTVMVYADWTATAGQSIDIIRAAKSGLHVSGNELANRLYGTAGVDHLSGGGGADILYDGETSERHYSEPRDTLAGGEGNDRYYVNSYLTIVEEDAEGGADRVYAACDYQLLDNVEQLYANTTNDVHLSGNDGANVIVGGSGDNEIAGGGGRDLLTGGAGADTFVFIDYGLDTADRVMDFEAGVDKIEFRPIYRDFAPEDFKVIGGGTRGVVDADDRVIYNASTGQLFYDANGASDGARELIATFTGKPAIGYGDFILGELP
jgi:Ca2+-binding RTX toxin-like protein